ncbi:MAG: T9SS type A sorting domain-containing protein [Paludibacter sp.]|nr:T9SS type A sorting domain-containing protein [Paludibacter sp.]
MSSIFLCTFSATVAGKQIYVPSALGNVNDNTNQWCYERSIQSDNFIVFWEAGYGSNPNGVQVGGYTANVQSILALAETCFDFYADSLKFITRGNSKTDLYKIIIRLYHTADWIASGSGMDDKIGVLNLSTWAASALGVTVAHEVGHCFQYQVHCDGWQGGWMYGLGNNGAGGNCFWEMCAQWQAFKVFPTQQFTDGRFNNYLKTAHKHILHETPRYDNFFIQDYWSYLHGMDFIGRLWQQSHSPEDPVEAYQRITGITQEEFNDEIYDCATRFVTWDIPALRANGASRILSRAQTKMNADTAGYWRIDASNCPENYGYNVIRLNLTQGTTTIVAAFEGILGNASNGFRAKNPSKNGWRFGFVHQAADGTRTYSPMHSAHTSSPDIVPRDTITFACPAGGRLWFVVTGAPTQHWHHEWDDNDTNDEQWGYRVKFLNTNLVGETNITTAVSDIIYPNSNEVTVRNLMGQVRYKGNADNFDWQNKLPVGIYLVTTNGKTTKIMIQNK